MHYRQAFIEVVKDLFGGTALSTRTQEEIVSRGTLMAPVAILPPAAATRPVPHDFTGQADIGTHTVAYIVVASARVLVRPVQAFDSVLMVLSYATAVTVLRHEGRFTSIEYRGTIGFVHKDELVYRTDSIFPAFVSGVCYDAHHEVTQAVRRYIADDFFTEALYLPLLSVEYVSYVLKQNGRILAWPATRPRKAGSWHTLLRGVRGIHIGLVPRTGAIIEYDVPEGESVLGYVEAVRPDGMLILTTVGRTQEGQFERYELAEDIYRESKALFISVT